MGSDDVRFDLIEGQVEPDRSAARESANNQDDPPAAPLIPQETLERTLRLWQRRLERLRAD